MEHENTLGTIDDEATVSCSGDGVGTLDLSGEGKKRSAYLFAHE